MGRNRLINAMNVLLLVLEAPDCILCHQRASDTSAMPHIHCIIDEVCVRSVAGEVLHEGVPKCPTGQSFIIPPSSTLRSPPFLSASADGAVGNVQPLRR